MWQTATIPAATARLRSRHGEAYLAAEALRTLWPPNRRRAETTVVARPAFHLGRLRLANAGDQILVLEKRGAQFLPYGLDDSDAFHGVLGGKRWVTGSHLCQVRNHPIGTGRFQCADRGSPRGHRDYLHAMGPGTGHV